MELRPGQAAGRDIRPDGEQRERARALQVYGAGPGTPFSAVVRFTFVTRNFTIAFPVVQSGAAG